MVHIGLVPGSGRSKPAAAGDPFKDVNQLTDEGTHERFCAPDRLGHGKSGENVDEVMLAEIDDGEAG
jgi:hypothetical protein